jgi:hypothetical protein
MVALRSLFFTILMPGTVAGVVPWLLLQSSEGAVQACPIALADWFGPSAGRIGALLLV